MKMVKEDVGTYLLKYNIKPSYLRMRIMEYLISQKNHPTVDDIYNELIMEIPTLSRTTIYNTLNLFVAADITRVVTIEDHETRYDADISDHGHFKCEKCGKVYDFFVPIHDIKTEELSNFEIHEKNVYYKGICSECLHNK